MPLNRKRLLRYSLIAVLAGALVVAFTPLLVVGGLRAWLWWQARQQKLTLEVESIEASYLRPVVMHRVHMASAPDASFRIDATAAQVTLELNLQSILLRTRGRAIRTLSIESLHAELHRNASGRSVSEAGWNALQKSLPNYFRLNRAEVRVEDGPTVIMLRDLSLNASDTEAGHFGAADVMISSPLFRQTFSALRGSTTWQDDRLTVAGLSLSRGLDVQSIAIDLAHLSKQRVGLEFDVDAFGGKIRTNVSNEWHSNPPTWNLVGSATDISLAQTSEGLGFTDRVNGMVHACKFTFRGDPHDPTHATASLWTELTGLSWRNRAADVIMLGAALYNRQIQLQQLYVKQSNNQLTLNGEAAFPNKSADWLNPDFRGDISASISDLGDFASLFGAKAGDFAGEIVVEGIMNAGERKIGGHLTATGKSLSIFKTPVDTFAARVNIKATDLEIEQLELHQQSDFMRAQGKVDLAHDHAYSGTSTIAAKNIDDYSRFLPFSWSTAISGGMVNCDWSGSGNATSHSGTFHVRGHGVRVSKPAWLLPFDAELDGIYSPGNLFFQQAHLANEHASINGFITIASKYLQLQALACDINGKPTIRGNVFLPIALSKTFPWSNAADAVDLRQKVDVDLAIESTDLADISKALSGRGGMSGLLAARLSIFGSPDALQGWSEIHLRDFAAPDDATRSSAEVETRFVSGKMNTKAGIQFRGSDPISVEASLPLRLGQQLGGAAADPISANFTFPAVFLARLPRYLSHDLFRDGILSGKLEVSETMRHPKISGDLQVTNGKLGNTPLHLTDMSGRLSFKGETASIDFMNLGNADVALSFRGELNFADPPAVDIKLLASQPIVDLAPRQNSDCISSVKMMPSPLGQPILTNIDQIAWRGRVFASGWTVTLTDHRNDQSLGANAAVANRTFRFCADPQSEGQTLILGCEPRPQPRPEMPRPRKRSKHR